MQFQEIIGQDQAVAMIKSAVLHKHLAHAYLFSGPEGVGKRMAALALAQFINCRQIDSQTMESCGACPSCLKNINADHPDLIRVEPSGNSIKIEQIRQLNAKVALRAYEGAYKVIIIDNAHLMTAEAANSLLKTLEEPAENTVFILVTANVQQLPVTILSRCQQIVFQPLAINAVSEVLQRQYPQYDSRIRLAASLAGGSVKRAQELLTNETLLSQRNQLYQLLAHLTEQSVGDILFWCEQFDKDRPAVKNLLELAQMWYRDLLLLAAGGDQSLLVNHDHLALMGRTPYAIAVLSPIIQNLQRAIEQLETNAAPRLVLEIALIKIKRTLQGNIAMI